MTISDWGPADLAASKGRVVIKFWAPWCGPCKAMAPAVEQLAQRFDVVPFGQVNIDEHPDLAARFRVRSVPTVMGLEDGGTAWFQVGAVPASILASRIERWS